MIVAKFNTTKTVSGSSSSSQLQLPFSNSGTYNCVVDWGDGSTDTITSWNQAETLHTYTTAGEYTVEITGPCPGFQTSTAIDRSVTDFYVGLRDGNKSIPVFVEIKDNVVVSRRFGIKDMDVQFLIDTYDFEEKR